ncbi:hypothetical protein [Streptomyces cucumeris]|uniref:hypothetical protein n=1 Tax=Streptomyces cucumeris TaxID=2962890 RepID=UPI0020C8DC5C|nr:hypothetical protein [Streptomyces sp. NEAU-Y11]MCP9209636.1 hypothetical protein [Streptomyces sp. NEAU-Y11]
MQRDDEPTILASIAAASARVRKAESEKRAVDSAAREAKERARRDRDRERRVLVDRVITATQNAVSQKLIADQAGRTREWVRLMNLCAVDPGSVTATVCVSLDGSVQDWRTVAEGSWIDVARKKGLEPLSIDSFKPKDNQVAQVLVHDRQWTLLLDGDTVRVAVDNDHYPDPAFGADYKHEKES